MKMPDKWSSDDLEELKNLLGDSPPTSEKFTPEQWRQMGFDPPNNQAEGPTTRAGAGVRRTAEPENMTASVFEPARKNMRAAHIRKYAGEPEAEGEKSTTETGPRRTVAPENLRVRSRRPQPPKPEKK